MKNILIEYKGGGYSGCFWEYNYCIYNEKGKWKNVYSSGYAGCDTEEKMKKFMETEKESEYTFYSLKKKDLSETIQQIAIGHRIMLAKSLFALEFITIESECDQCGKRVPVMHMHPSGMFHESGLVYAPERLVCDECEEYNCNYQNALYEADTIADECDKYEDMIFQFEEKGFYLDSFNPEQKKELEGILKKGCDED